jgi:hypothetical protein
MGYMSMEHILVGINLSEWLSDSIILKNQGKEYTQELDYEGIPFRCRICHTYGHLAADLSKQESRKKWVKKFDSKKLPSTSPPK